MNYSELKTNIQDICEMTFTNAQLDMFTDQAEQKIYNTVQIPALRRNVVGTLTNGNKYLNIPSDFLYVYSLSVVNSSSAYVFLLNKDVNFIREAYPTPTVTGFPVHYSLFSDSAILLGPTPNSGYTTELHYGYYPPSIVTASTTWLGNEFDSALLNGALVEAVRFMKGEVDVISNYEKLYQQAIVLLKNLGDGKLREDAYRSGQYRQEVG
mgnify:FL=1|tara:strand:+ start:2284 stop:2913 length:630 start_codon:yes stop_codon:yes gene_type:complete